MDTTTGNLYPTEEAALRAGVAKDALVMLTGSPQAVHQISEDVKAQRRAKAKAAKRARRRNR